MTYKPEKLNAIFLMQNVLYLVQIHFFSGSGSSLPENPLLSPSRSKLSAKQPPPVFSRGTYLCTEKLESALRLCGPLRCILVASRWYCCMACIGAEPSQRQGRAHYGLSPGSRRREQCARTAGRNRSRSSGYQCRMQTASRFHSSHFFALEKCISFSSFQRKPLLLIFCFCSQTLDGQGPCVIGARRF